MIKSGVWIRKNNWWVTGIIAGFWGLWNFVQDFHRSEYSTWYPFFLDFLVLLKSHSGLMIVVIGVIWALWSLVMANDKNWVLIDKLLNLTREKVFNHFKGEPREHHQVTLFQYRKRLLKLGYIRQSVVNSIPNKIMEFIPERIVSHESRLRQGWLVSIRRAGFTGRNGGTIFALSTVTAENEGICGQSWISGEIKESRDLPRVTLSVGEKPIKDYAAKGHCSQEYVEQKIKKCGKNHGKNTCLLPRSIVAFPIGDLDLSEAPKYILVFDSRNKDGIQKDVRDEYSVVNDMLGSLLSGV